MSKLVLSLASLLLLGTAVLAAPPWPDEVLVGTDPTSGKQFKAWVEADGAKYAGTYKGDIGGDTAGELIVKVTKPKSGESPLLLSGTFTQTTAGGTPMTFKFDNLPHSGEDGPSLNAFGLSFVKLDKTPGVIIGSVFIPRK